jgi:hypothetical protein
MAKAQHTARGVIYSAIVHAPNHVELRAGAVTVGTASIEVRLLTTHALGGDGRSSEAILAALERDLAAALTEPTPARPTPKAKAKRPRRGIQGPWYVTVSAVRDYLRIRGKPESDDGPDFEQAESELVELARAIVATGKSGVELDSGAYRFRGPKPLRLRLTVTYDKRPEGNLPQLVAVAPDHEARVGAYSRSAPHQRGKNG